MKKQYVQPLMAVEAIETELPIAISLGVDSNPAKTLNDDDDFLSKGRKDIDGSKLW